MHGMLLPARGTSLSCLQTLRYVPCLHHITPRPKDKGQVRRSGLFFCADSIHLAEEIAETHGEEDGTVVFAGLAEDVGVVAEGGLRNAEELGTKVQLATSLNAVLAEWKLTQAEAARVLGVNQPKVSALKGYKLEGFSVERLMHFATALQHDVVIEIRPRAANRGAGRVMVVGAA